MAKLFLLKSATSSILVDKSTYKSERGLEVSTNEHAGASAEQESSRLPCVVKFVTAATISRYLGTSARMLSGFHGRCTFNGHKSARMDGRWVVGDSQLGWLSLLTYLVAGSWHSHRALSVPSCSGWGGRSFRKIPKELVKLPGVGHCYCGGYSCICV